MMHMLLFCLTVFGSVAYGQVPLQNLYVTQSNRAGSLGNSIIILLNNGSMSYEVPTRGEGGNPRHSLGSIARYRDVLAVTNYKSKTVSMFTRSVTHNTFAFVKLLKTQDHPVSVTFSDNHLYVLENNHVESFRNIQGQVNSLRDGFSPLTLRTNSSIQVLYQKTPQYRNMHAWDATNSSPRQLLYFTELGSLDSSGAGKQGEVSHIYLDSSGKIANPVGTLAKTTPQPITQLSDYPAGSFSAFQNGDFLINPGGLAQNFMDLYSNQIFITVLNRNQTIVIRNEAGETYDGARLVTVTDDVYTIGGHGGDCQSKRPFVPSADENNFLLFGNQRLQLDSEPEPKNSKRVGPSVLDKQPWGIAATGSWVFVAHPHNYGITTYSTRGYFLACYENAAFEWISSGDYNMPYELYVDQSTWELSVLSLKPASSSAGVSVLSVFSISQNGQLTLKFHKELPVSASWHNDSGSTVGARGVLIFPASSAGRTTGYY